MVGATNGIEGALDRLIAQRIDACFGELDSCAVMPVAPPAEVTLDIIVPVHGAFEAFEACLQRLLQHTEARHRIVLIDDASDDSRVHALMQSAARDRATVEVRRNAVNLGYLATVNAAIERSSSDIVLLNSDAMVDAGWLDRLARAANAEPVIGISCPLSDHATILSVVDVGVSVTDFAAAARDERPRLPVAVGFCMYVRRVVFDAIGVFDPAFDPGYGEETDFSMRAWQAGFEIVVATDVFVAHLSGSSFGRAPEILRWRAVHERLMQSRWPQYESVVRDWWRDWPLREQCERLRSVQRNPRDCALHVVHRSVRLGGTELHTRALVQSLARHLDVDLLAPEPGPGWADAIVQEHGPGWTLREVNARHATPNQRIFGVAADLSDPFFDRHLLRTIVGAGHSILHVHSLLHWNSLLAPLLAREVGMRVVISVHALESLCPDYTLAPAPAFRACGKSHAGVDPGCVTCLSRHWWKRPGVNVPDPRSYLAARLHFWRRVIAAADVVIAPSQFAIDRLAGAFGDLLKQRAYVLPHGIARVPARTRGVQGPNLRVGFLAGWVRVKGIDTVVECAQPLLGEPIRFIVHGVDDRAALPAKLPQNLELHGMYRPVDLSNVLADVDLVLLPATVEETFSLVLSECRAAGIPVAASNLGAFRERIRHGVDGWLLDPHSADAWSALLRGLVTAAGREQLRGVSETLRSMPIRTIDHEADAYADIYRALPPRLTPSRASSKPARALDVASLRLRQQWLQTAALEQPSWLRDTLAPGTTESPSVSIVAVILVTSRNAELLSSTRASLDVFADANVCIVRSEAVADVAWPGATIINADDPDAAQRVARFTAAHATQSTWHIVIDAGDQLHASTPRWLGRQTLDGSGLICCDLDFTDRDGRHHGGIAQPAWDPWLAHGATTHAEAMFVRGDLLATIGGWAWPLAFAKSSAQFACSERGIEPTQVPRVLVHLADRNLSIRQRDGAQCAYRELFAGHRNGGLRWSAIANAVVPGCSLTPAFAREPSVAIVITDSALVSEDAVRALSASTRWPGLQVIGWQVVQELPAVDVIVLLREGLWPRTPDWLAILMAWLQDERIAAVSPRRRDRAGLPLPIGQHFDGTSVRMLADPSSAATLAADAWSNCARQVPALSTDCLAVRQCDVSSAWINRLAAPDGLSTWVAQIEWQRELGKALVWVPRAELQQTQSLRTSIGAVETDDALEHAQNVWRDSSPALRTRLRHAPAHRIGVSLAGVPKRGPRIAALTRDAWASSQYRVHLPLDDLRRHGYIDGSVVWRLREEPAPGILEIEAEAPDALLFHHALDDRSLSLMEHAARALSIPRVVLIDDLLTDVPTGNPMAATMFPDIEQRLHRALSSCTVMVATSAGIADAYGKLAPRTVIIENALEATAWPQPAARTTSRGRLRVGWAGAEQHADDLAFLSGLMLHHADVQWVFLGMAPDHAASNGAEVHPMVPFADYPARMAALDLDIALVPIVDNDYNRCKSLLKVLEWGALGVPVIASALPPYLAAPVIHASAGADSWSIELQRLLANPALRAAHGDALRQWVERHHFAEHRRSQWIDALSLSRSTTGEPCRA